MEPQNGGLEDEISFSKGWCSGSMLVFRRVPFNTQPEPRGLVNISGGKLPVDVYPIWKTLKVRCITAWKNILGCPGTEVRINGLSSPTLINGGWIGVKKPTDPITIDPFTSWDTQVSPALPLKKNVHLWSCSQLNGPGPKTKNKKPWDVKLARGSGCNLW